MDFVALRGEEFAVVLSHTLEDIVLSAGEGPCAAIEDYSWRQRQITVSSGVSTLDDNIADINDLIDKSDRPSAHRNTAVETAPDDMDVTVHCRS